MTDTDPRSAILFAESLVPEGGYDDTAEYSELLELWLIAEIDAAIEALVDGAEVFTLGELVRTTPTPKTGALPGLVMVHYERRVDWTEPAGEAFTIEDAATDDEDGEDWTPIPRSSYVDESDMPNGDDDLAEYTAEELADRDAILGLAVNCKCDGCRVAEVEESSYTDEDFAAFGIAVGEKLDRDLGLEP